MRILDENLVRVVASDEMVEANKGNPRMLNESKRRLADGFVECLAKRGYNLNINTVSILDLSMMSEDTLPAGYVSH